VGILVVDKFVVGILMVAILVVGILKVAFLVVGILMVDIDSSLAIPLVLDQAFPSEVHSSCLA
jgi:hypothetical protein